MRYEIGQTYLTNYKCKNLTFFSFLMKNLEIDDIMPINREEIVQTSSAQLESR